MNRILFAFIASFVTCSALHANDQEQTLAIIKPDAVKQHSIGEIISRYEKTPLTITNLKMATLSKKDAEAFYAVHKKRPFFSELVTFMTSGPVVVLSLEGTNAVAKNRELIGATNPLHAAIGTLRSDYGTSIQYNAVHGSDSVENGKKEVAFFFSHKKVLSKK